MRPAVGDDVEYAAIGPGAYPAKVIGVRADGRVDLDISIPGLIQPMTFTRIDWIDGPEAENLRGIARPRSPK